MQLRVLTSSEVRAALPMPEAVAAMKAAFAAFSAGEAQVPLRTRLDLPGREAVALFMPAFVPASGDLAIKAVSVFPQNPSLGLPTIHALVLVFHPETGQPLALLDGGSLTALRTGAASGAATDLLARADSQILAVFGSGVQARTQVEAVCAVRPIRQVRVFSLDQAGAGEMALELTNHGGIEAEFRISPSPGEAAAGADVISTATTSATPVVPDSAVAAGAHINAIGAYTPQMQEIEPDTVARARVFVDSRSAALAEAGDLLVPIRQGRLTDKVIIGELGDLIAGSIPGRTHLQEITLFKSVGLAVQDAVAAGAIVRRASSLGLGRLIDV